MIRFKASPMNITIIQSYTPTTTYTYEEIEQLYEYIDNVMKETPKKDFLMIQGDFNAKVDKNVQVEWPEFTGRFGIGDQNDREKGCLNLQKNTNL